MHHILRGVLGAALVYPFAWYYYAQTGVVQSVAPEVAPSPSERKVSSWTEPMPVRVEPAQAEPYERASPVREQVVARAVTEHVPAVAPQLVRPVEPELPRAPGVTRPSVAKPSVNEPSIPLPPLAELQEVFGQMKELQRYSHDPQELEQRVQGMEQDPQKLAKLRAFADMFLKLPASPSDGYLPAAERSPSTPR
jgi:hypothetical protein